MSATIEPVLYERNFDTETRFDPFHENPPPAVPRYLGANQVHDPERGVRPETVCEEAQRIVYGDREKTYDHPSRNFERTAHLWNGYLRAKYGPDVPALDTHDVAWMMTQLKLARLLHKYHRDGVVDFIGYAACVAKMVDHDGPQ